MKLDAANIAKSIGETMKRAGIPISDDQLMVMIGALHIWLEKVREERN